MVKRARPLTYRQEAFAQILAAGTGTQSAAYIAAYTATGMAAATIRIRACEMAKNIKVVARVEALRAPVVKKLRFGIEQAMLEAGEAFATAKSLGQAGAMVAAATLRAKLSGLLVERKEIAVSPLDGLSYSDLQEMLAAVSGQSTH